MKKINKKSGFTLVELMVVAAIIAILAAIIIPLVTKNKEEAVAAEGKNLAGAVMNAAKAQYVRTDSWPAPAAIDDALLLADVASASWSVTTCSGPTPSTVTVTTAGKNGYSGTVTLTDGAWTVSLSEL